MHANHLQLRKVASIIASIYAFGVFTHVKRKRKMMIYYIIF